MANDKADRNAASDFQFITRALPRFRSSGLLGDLSMRDDAEEMHAETKCCGELVTTRFCPHCGTEKLGHNLLTLLVHCRNHLNRAVAALEDAKLREDERSIRIRSSPVRKWEAWVKALESVV